MAKQTIYVYSSEHPETTTTAVAKMNDNFTELYTADTLKVDKEAGKGLSTNDYTTTEKNKLDGIQAGAQVNPASTDNLGEGSTNLYFTLVRVLGSVLTGLTTGSRVALAATDTILEAFGKIQKWLADLGDAAFKNVGTGSTNVAAGDHNHTGVYSPMNYTPNTKNDSAILALTDLGTMLRMEKGTALTLTIPPNSDVAVPIGTWQPVIQSGAGQLTFVAGIGVTINTVGSRLKIAAQGCGAMLYKSATDVWDLTGDLIS